MSGAAARAPSFRLRDLPLLGSVDWSLSYVAFLAYIFAIVTYRLPIGTGAMVTALVALPLEKRPLRFPPVLGWTLALLGWAWLGWTTTDYPGVVYDTVVEFTKVAGIILVAVNVLTSRARLRLFLVLFLGFFAFYPARGTLIAYFFYGGGVEGRAAWNYAYANPNDLGGMCLLMTALAAGVFVADRALWIRVCAFAGILLLPFVILLTASRGAFIALAACAAFALRGYLRKPRILAIGAAAIAMLAFLAPHSVWVRLGTISDVTSESAAAKANDEGSARQRLEIWKVARTIVAENPVTGVGLGAYPDAHFAYAQRPNFDPTAMGHRDTHSTYLSIAAQTGVPGLLIFLALVGTTVADAERTRRRMRLAAPRLALQLQYMELGLLGYLVAGIWGSYGFLVLTYLYVSLIYVTTELLKAESALPIANGRGATRRRRSMPNAQSAVVR
jgi:O-antigen ligase